MPLPQLARPGRRLPRVLLVPPPRLQPGQPGLRHGGVGGLPELVGQPGRLEVARLGVGPAVGGRVVAGDGAEQQRQVRRTPPAPGAGPPARRAARAPSPRAGTSVRAPPSAPAAGPRDRRPTGTARPARDELGPPVAVPRQDVGHARRGEADPADRVGGRGTHEVDHASRRRERGRGVAQVEAGVHRVGEQEHRTVGIGPGGRRRAGEEGVARGGQRAAPGLHRAAQLADPHRLLRRARPSGSRSSSAVARAGCPASQACPAAASARDVRSPGSGDSAAARSSTDAATAWAPRPSASAAVATSTAATASSGPEGRLGEVPGAAVPHGGGRRDLLDLGRARRPARRAPSGGVPGRRRRGRLRARAGAGTSTAPAPTRTSPARSACTRSPTSSPCARQARSSRARSRVPAAASSSTCCAPSGSPADRAAKASWRPCASGTGTPASRPRRSSGRSASSSSASGLPAVARCRAATRSRPTAGPTSDARRVDGQAGQRERSEPRVGQRGRLAGPQRHQHGHAVVDQPPQREGDRLGGRPVEQVGVVDQDQQGLVVGGPAEQAQRGHPDAEPVRARARPGAQRDAEGLLLRAPAAGGAGR